MAVKYKVKPLRAKAKHPYLTKKEAKALEKENKKLRKLLLK